MTKTEERLENAIKKTLIEKLKESDDIIVNKTSVIFLYGTVFGVLFAYTHLAPLLIGIVIGITIAKSDLPFINNVIIFVVNYVSKSHGYIHEYILNKSKEITENKENRETKRNVD